MNLNLECDAKVRYEFFKSEWQHIVERDAADLEELLYDTEKAADVYNFPKANKLMQKLDGNMVTIENRIESITSEMNELLEIDEKNNETRANFDPRLEKIQAHITDKHDVFYLVASKWEKEIEQIHNGLTKYDAYVEDGSYKKSADLIKSLNEEMGT